MIQFEYEIMSTVTCNILMTLYFNFFNTSYTKYGYLNFNIVILYKLSILKLD